MATIGFSVIESSLGKGGGTDVYTYSLARALMEAEMSHTLLLLADQDHAKDWLTIDSSSSRVIILDPGKATGKLNFRSRYLRSIDNPSQFVWRKSELNLANQIESINLDLIHFPRTTIYPLSVKTPAILTFFDLQHIFFPQFFSFRTKLARNRRYKYSVSVAKKTIVPSKFTADTLRNRYQIPAEKLTIIPVGINSSWNRTNDRETERIRKKYQLPEKFAFYPANPWPHKNHSRLMKALRICEDDFGISPHLVLSGKLVNEKSNKLFLNDRSEFINVIDLGFVPSEDLMGIYSSATLLIYPSLFEGFGIPLIEAMACGCPIAAANVTSIPEVVGDVGLLFDPYNPQDIAEAIYRLYTDRKLRNQLAQAGSERVKQYSWDILVPQIVNLYNQVIDSG